MANIGYLAVIVDTKTINLPGVDNRCVYEGEYFPSLDSLTTKLISDPPNLLYPAYLIVHKVEGLTRIVDEYRPGDEAYFTVQGLIKIDKKDGVIIQKAYFDTNH